MTCNTEVKRFTSMLQQVLVTVVILNKPLLSVSNTSGLIEQRASSDQGCEPVVSHAEICAARLATAATRRKMQVSGKCCTHFWCGRCSSAHRTRVLDNRVTGPICFTLQHAVDHQWPSFRSQRQRSPLVARRRGHRRALLPLSWQPAPLHQDPPATCMQPAIGIL